jgi:uncharacterized protein (TIGR03083 family)
VTLSHPRREDEDLVVAFFRACDLALDVARSDPISARWESDSVLEGFTIGALVAHLYSAIRLFESALDKPEASYDRVGDITSFYILNRVDDRVQLQDDFHVAIRRYAAQLAEQGPDVLIAKFDALATRPRGALADVAMTRLVPIWRIEGGATQLGDYLRTRVVELVVHADDLAASVDIEIEIPAEAAGVAFAAFLDLARSRSGDVAVMRAFARGERCDPEVLRVL